MLALCAALSAVPARAADGDNAPSVSTNPVAVPIEFKGGRVMVPVKINGSRTLSFLLDTGYGVTMIHPDLVEPLGLKRAGRLTIVGIAGEEEAGTYSGAMFDFGGVTYAPRRVASLPSEAQNSRRRRDGILGAGFFRRFVVEIDPPAKVLRLHEAKTFEYSGSGEVIPLQFPSDTPIIDAAIVGTNGVAVRGRFEIDTGCDDGLCLGREFSETNRLAAFGDEARSETKRGVGGGARILSGTVPALQLGRLTLAKPSTSFFTDGSPAGPGLAGHIGMAALRRSRVIFDYSRRRMIVEALPRGNGVE